MSELVENRREEKGQRRRDEEAADNGDGVTEYRDIPDVVCTTYDLQRDGASAPAYLRMFSGDCSESAIEGTYTVDWVNFDNAAGLAVGDHTNDGIPEIVLYAFNHLILHGFCIYMFEFPTP